MTKEKMIRICLLVIFSLLLFGCYRQAAFEVKDFLPISNFPNESTVKYTVDLKNAITDGVIIPTKDGIQDYFKIQFSIKNNSKKAKKYYYKIFYQNESYAYELFSDSNCIIKNPKASDNFYGSWNLGNTGFHSTGIINPEDDYTQVTDSFCILGNPRNEKVFFGGKHSASPITNEEIKKAVSRIKDTKMWMEQIQNKAGENNMSLEKQIYLDAIWSINFEKQHGNYNNRWKRNPRTGIYNFLLVVIEEDYLNKIPDHYQDVTMKDSVTNNYQNPYQFYLGTVRDDKDIISVVADQKLKVKVKYELNKGIYLGASQEKPDSIVYYAQFEQYFHPVTGRNIVHNIPVKEDVVANEYSIESYRNNAAKFKENELLNDYIKITDTPGYTVGYDEKTNTIFFKNPGNALKEKYRKENVGVKTRYGFTYGKYIAKIKFPKIINSTFVWNGLTCAFWLKYQGGNWNKRSNCLSGFNPKLYSDSVRVESTIYSEIDIEIVKTSKYWPKTSYKGRVYYPVDSALNENIILSCTNWDLACHDPDSFNIGVRDITYNNKEFTLHRWDDKYRALTSKYEYNQDSVLGKMYYYVIEWHPTFIIWKIGPTLDELMVIGYMDDKCTMIPDNQMQMVFSHGFHLSEWWPLTPFKQEYIPYPLNDITSYIYEVEIE